MRYLVLFLFNILAASAIYAQSPAMREHIIQRGETFDVIAQRYGITDEALHQANPKVKKCFTGMKLLIPEHLITTTDTRLIATPAENEKADGPSFWDKLGDIAGAVGDVMVASAEVLSTTGLLDDTGDVGVIVGGGADIVNSTRGVQSNFIAQATQGTMNMGADGYMYTEEPTLGTSGQFSPDVDTQQLRQRLSEVEAELNQVEQELAFAYNQANSSGGRRKMLTGSRKALRETRNSPLESRRKALNQERSELLTQIAMTEGWYEELQEDRAANRQHSRDVQRRNDEALRKRRIEAATYLGKQKAKDSARDQNIDIENNTSQWIDAHGVQGTQDIYDRNKQTIQKYSK